MAPTRCSTILPSLKSSRVGMPRTLYRIAVLPLESTSSFPTFNLPAYSVATVSIVGPICRQGPHHSAQKSTRTGTSDPSTSLSNVESEKVNVFNPAMSSPKPYLLDHRAGQRIQCRPGHRHRRPNNRL